MLPHHKGLDTHQRAIDAKDSVHGCSVHLVTAGMDEGPVIAQASVKIDPQDTEESLAGKVLRQEHILYPTVIGALATGRLTVARGQIVIKEGALPGKIKGFDGTLHWPPSMT